MKRLMVLLLPLLVMGIYISYSFAKSQPKKTSSAKSAKPKAKATKMATKVTGNSAVDTKIQRALDIGATELPSSDTCPYDTDFGTACCACAIDMAQSPGWAGILSSKLYNPESFLGACSAQCTIEFPTPCDYICNQAFPGPKDCSTPSPESPRACALFQAKKADCIKRCTSSLKGGFTCSQGSACFGPNKAKWGDSSFCASLAKVICNGDETCTTLVKNNCLNGGKSYYSDHAQECNESLKKLCADTSVCKGSAACLNDKKCTESLQSTYCSGTAMPMFECGNKDSCTKIANYICREVNDDVLPQDKDKEICRDEVGKKVDCACRDAFLKTCMGDCQFFQNSDATTSCQKACFEKAKSQEFLDQFQNLGRGGPFGWCDRQNCNLDCPESAQPGPLCKSCLRKCLYQAASMQQKQIDCIQKECAAAQTGDTSCVTKCQAQYPIIDCRFYCTGKANDCGLDQNKIAWCDQKYPCTSSFQECNYQVGAKCTDAYSACADEVGVNRYFSTCNAEFGNCNCQPSANSCYNNYLCKTLAYPNAGCKG